MFNLNSSLHCESAAWDTNFARTYLQISDDQLEKINKIPGWTKVDTSENVVSENDKTLGNIEKRETQQASTSTENILTTNTKISEKDDTLRTKNHNSDLQLKQKSNSPTTKEVFLKQFSLSPIKKKNTLYSLQRSSSLPNLCDEYRSPRKLKEIYKNPANSEADDVSNYKFVPILRNYNLNENYTVPITSNSSVSNDKLSQINSSKSCSLEHPNRTSKLKEVGTLDDCILSHKYLEGSEKFVTFSQSSKSEVKITLQQEMSLLDKKLLLLEKRLSPAKEISPPPFNAKLINVENLSINKSLISSQNLASTKEVMTAAVNSDSHKNIDFENFSKPKSHNYLELQASSHLLNEKYDSSKILFESVKESSGIMPKATTCNFESFLSPPVPCGQPAVEVSSRQPAVEVSCGQPSVEVPSLSRPVSLEKSILTSKLPITHQSVFDEQLPQTKDPSLSQPLSMRKLHALNELENVEFSGQLAISEKPSGTFNVLSINSNEKVSDLQSIKELGTRRKRKNKSEKSSKKLDAKKVKRTHIQFSSTQIRNILEMTKILLTEL